MFYYLSGSLTLISHSLAVIDVGGAGYSLTVSRTTYSALARLDDASCEKVKLFTYLIVREDALELCGFYTEEELSVFKLLITVSGVGPKAALSVLSTLNPSEFAVAVCSNNTKAISAASGVGPKTAARIILELKDKISKDIANSGDLDKPAGASGLAAKSGKLADVESALSVLGFSHSDIAAAVDGIDIDGTALEEIIRLALKKFTRG